MTWKYLAQLAKRFVAPVPSVQRKLSDKFHTSISSDIQGRGGYNYTIENNFRTIRLDTLDFLDHRQ